MLINAGTHIRREGHSGGTHISNKNQTIKRKTNSKRLCYIVGKQINKHKKSCDKLKKWQGMGPQVEIVHESGTHTETPILVVDGSFG